jgi:hypothetical protein
LNDFACSSRFSYYFVFTISHQICKKKIGGHVLQVENGSWECGKVVLEEEQ